MTEWLKCFGLGFFIHRQSKEAASRSFLNFLLGFVLSLAFIFCGVLMANTVPLPTHLKNAGKYLGFVGNAFSSFDITVSDGRAQCGQVVDTFADKNSPFKINGYELVIDTRSAEVYDDFIAEFVNSDNRKITPEQYAALSDDDKKGYKLEITYTPNELILTDELIEGFEAYLSSSASAEEFQKLQAGKDGNTSYDEQVYALYLKTFYPDFVRAAGATVPRLRSYYYINYIGKSVSDKYLCLFDDIVVGEFKTDGGMSAVFYGLVENTDDGKVTDGNAKDFIISAVKGATGMIATEYLVTVVRNMPLIVLVPAALALLMAFALKAIGADEKQSKYLSCLRVQGIFLAYAALISAFVNFIFGFFIPAKVLNRLPVWLFFAVMLIRNIAYLTAEKISINKSKPTVAEIIKADENKNS